MPVLIELRSKSNGKFAKIKLSDVVDNAPATLKTLSFSRARLAVDLCSIKQCNVNLLSFIALKFQRHMDSFIVQYFPKLSVLKVKHCEIDDNTLTLPTLKLVKFEFGMHTNDKHLTVLLACNNTIQLYTCSSLYFRQSEFVNSKTIQESAVSIPFKIHSQTDTTITPHFVFMCNSLNQFTFVA